MSSGFKNNPGCNCCQAGVCDFEASGGNDYTDTFGTLDGGWSVNSVFGTWQIQVASGRFELELTTADAFVSSTGRAYRSAVSTPSSKIILESDLWSVGSRNQSVGLYFGTGSGGTVTARCDVLTGSSEYSMNLGGGSALTVGWGATVTWNDGDTVNFRVYDDGGDMQGCMFINGTLVISLTRASYTGWKTSNADEYGYASTGDTVPPANPTGVYLQADNLSVDVDP